MKRKRNFLTLTEMMVLQLFDLGQETLETRTEIGRGVEAGVEEVWGVEEGEKEMEDRDCVCQWNRLPKHRK